MVVAEIPLWLVHESSSGGPNGVLGGRGVGSSGSKANGGDGSSVALASSSGNKLNKGELWGASNNDSDNIEAQRELAQDSLSLLENSGRGKKCAIYSVDVDPTGRKFATSGGDGMVRLWSVSALFSRKRSRYTDNGSYQSSEASASGSASESASDSNSESSSPNDKNNKDPNHRKRNRNRNRSRLNSSKNDSSSLSNLFLNATEQQEELVHDLNDFVRRKKGGETLPRSPASTTKKSLSGEKSATHGLPSPSRMDNNTNTNTTSSHHHPRLLCTLAAHTGSSVLAVRFSTNGQYLASAGDDAVVCIYAQSATTSIISGNLTDNNANHNPTEHWARIKLCRGHGLDVVGLAWAPDDSHLVSCSLDSETPIIVWKLTDLVNNNGKTTTHSYSNVLCNPYKVLGKGIHTSTVKGVTFDPAGTYLASSGDDPAVCIWRAHDDWGLERRIDSNYGIFRRWKEDDTQSLSSQTLFRRLSWSTDGTFICSTNCVVKNRHVASTISREGWNVSNANSAPSAGAANLVGHKQPIMVSRHSSYLLKDTKKKKKRIEDDSANNDNEDDDDDEDDDEGGGEIDYATLLALGDRHGFVTVWSTRKARPIFKLQCSESRCTVTDLAWGKIKNDHLLLLVSLLDGHIVALRFTVPDELGPLLSEKEQARVFQLRYGIDHDVDGDVFGRRRLFVGENSGPNFVENALQLSLEDRIRAGEDDSKMDIDNDNEDEDDTQQNTSMQLSTPPSSLLKRQQNVSRTEGGKKRIRPVLMSMGASPNQNQQRVAKKSSSCNTVINGEKVNLANKRKVDPIQHAVDLANKASAATDTVVPNCGGRKDETGVDRSVVNNEDFEITGSTATHATDFRQHIMTSVVATLPHSTKRVHSVDLPVSTSSLLSSLRKKESEETKSETTATTETKEEIVVADCSNSIKVPSGSQGAAIPCADVSISRCGRICWRDQIPGTSCSALAASTDFLAVGTSDGCVQLYGTSSTMGWTCTVGFRSHPPFVFGQSVVALQLHEKVQKEGDRSKASAASNLGEEKKQVDMLVLIADGTFAVYSLLPEPKLKYKGSVMPAMTHMNLGFFNSTGSSNGLNQHLPTVSRIQITESDRLFLLLSSNHSSSNRVATSNIYHGGSRSPVSRQSSTSSSRCSSVGGSLQAFVYNTPMELWMRISDGRFALSEFYSTLPSTSNKSVASAPLGENISLSRFDNTIRMGAIESSLVSSGRGSRVGGGNVQQKIDEHHADSIYEAATAANGGDSYGTFTATRSHCEDRMACSLALHSTIEFKHWLTLYVRTLSRGGHGTLLRVLVDLLLGTRTQEQGQGIGQEQQPKSKAYDKKYVNNIECCWWLSSAPKVLNLDRMSLVETIIIPEMSKNRALQRITNEVSLEIDIIKNDNTIT